MRILFIGDIVGKPAREYLKENLPHIREEQRADFVIANGENAAGGSGITPDTAQQLFACGIDVLTSGDHIFKKKQAKEVLEKTAMVRPLNYGEFAWGQGYLIKEAAGYKVAVVNLLGRVFMQPVDCPFKAIRAVLGQIRQEARVIVVDAHAEATSEKLALAYFLAGKVSAVVGTHTHIPTADERIIEGTAYITDAGMTGSFDSILGREKHEVIERFITNLPLRFNLAQEDVRMQGVIIEVDAEGKALGIGRIEYKKES